MIRWCRNTLDRWFPPRELILRTDGRVSYLAISSRQQKVTATILLGFALWGGYATTSMIVNGRLLEAKRGELDRAQVAYVDLLNEVAHSYDQFLGFARNLNSDQKNLLAQGNNPTTGGGMSDVSQSQQQQSAVREKLRLFELDLKSVASTNKQLTDTVTRLHDELQVAKSQNSNLTQTREAVNAELVTTRQQLATELEAVRRVLSMADGRKTALADQVAVLQNDLATADRREAQGDLARHLAEEQIGMLLNQLNSARDDNAQLMRQITDTQTALATAVGQRDALQSARRDLTGRIGDLENQWASIQRSQQTIVERRAARTRNGVDEVEKTVAMTGVDVDGLLLVAAHELSGQGGPFIPVKEPPTEQGGEQLMASVASLDGEVGRLETLQLVLRTLPLTAPVDHYFIASNFGIRRDPFNGRLAFHAGLDLANSLLSPVLTTAPGVVVYAGWMGGYGRLVEIDHGLGVHTRYGHLARINVKVGDTVYYRQRIGLIVSCGRSSVRCVLFEVRGTGGRLEHMNFKAGHYVFKAGSQANRAAVRQISVAVSTAGPTRAAARFDHQLDLKILGDLISAGDEVRRVGKATSKPVAHDRRGAWSPAM
jgi:murein DD-endopeptidase MepM/ murein hydrolase activator NlpD